MFKIVITFWLWIILLNTLKAKQGEKEQNMGKEFGKTIVRKENPHSQYTCA